MKVGELALKIHVSRTHAWRLARAGIVPGAKRTKGGQFYFVQSSQLTRWINKMIGGKYRRNEMARAYSKSYGNPKLEQIRDMQGLKSAFKRAQKDANKVKLDEYDNTDYFYRFHFEVRELERILDELKRWRKSELKSELITLSRAQLLALRKAINKWLASY